MQIENINEHGIREVWTFWINVQGEDIQIVFDGYAQQTRTSKRHKWVTVVSWSRLGNPNRHEGPGRGIPRPELPAAVQIVALDRASKKLRVVEDWEYARR